MAAIPARSMISDRLSERIDEACLVIADDGEYEGGHGPSVAGQSGQAGMASMIGAKSAAFKDALTFISNVKVNLRSHIVISFAPNYVPISVRGERHVFVVPFAFNSFEIIIP